MALGVFVLSMSSEANRVKLLSAWNSIVGDGLSISIDSNDRNEFSGELVEQDAYDIIEKKLGIRSLKIAYLPKGMTYSNYLVDTKDEIAILYYTYNDTIMSVCMYGNSGKSMHSQKFDGEMVEDIKIYSEEIDAKIWKVLDSEKETYISQFKYNNITYTISGSMSENEFKKMLSSIIF